MVDTRNIEMKEIGRIGLVRDKKYSRIKKTPVNAGVFLENICF